MKYLAVLLLLLIGCSPKYLPIKEKTIVKDTTIFKDREVKIFTPGSSTNIDIDSLFEMWQKVYGTTVTRTVVKTDPTLQTKLTLFYDSLGKLVNAKCETLEKEHNLILQDKERRITKLQETVLEQQKTFGQKLQNTILSIIGGLISIVVLIIIGIILIKRMTS